MKKDTHEPEDSKIYNRLLLGLFLASIYIILIFVAESRGGQRIGLDIYLQALSSMTVFAGLTYQLINRWHIWPTRRKIFYLIALISTLFATVANVIQERSRFPWVQAEAMPVVESFMTDMKEEDYSAALTRFVPEIQQCLDESDLAKPEAKPNSWELEELDEYLAINGTAIFADGSTIIMRFIMEWNNGQWQISALSFEDSTDIRMRYVDYYCPT